MMEIAVMREEHLPALAHLEQVCFSEPWSEQGLRSELENPHAVFRVALVDRAPAGYAGMHHIIDEGYITNIAVFAQMRRQGVAQMLLGSLIDYAHSHRLALITLEVRASNQPAIQFYEKNGFQRVGLRKRFYRQPDEDALIMTNSFTRG